MALSVRLSKIGRKGIRAYRIVVAEARSKRDGKAVETIGSYNPSLKPPLIKINQERFSYWLSVGAKPTEAVRKLIGKGFEAGGEKRETGREVRKKK